MMFNNTFTCRLAALALLGTGIALSEDAQAGPPHTKYTCGVFVQSYVFTQYLTLKDDGTYESSIGPTGKFHYDAASKRILFDSGKFEPLFGSYEPKTYPMFRLSSREDMVKSDYTRAWRSQVCNGKSK
ncbi:MAG: hypothetical protein M3Z32_09545 [Acidobacteriota bacterium]|nr:hypothetical protein [Acidobacteriota bacterium]